MRNAAKPAEILAQNYLDSIADVLRSDGVNDDDIASVCDALKAQIFDIASQRGTATEDSVSPLPWKTLQVSLQSKNIQMSQATRQCNNWHP